MKNRLNFGIIALIVICLFAACGNDDDGLTQQITVDSEKTTLDQVVYSNETQGKSKVSFSTTAAWTSSVTETIAKSVKSDSTSVKWVSITPDSGDKAGNYSITINLLPNNTGENRSATIAIDCNGYKIDIMIMQKAKLEYEEKGCQAFYNAEGSVVINGVRWATRNVGIPGFFAASACESGEYYQWNRNVTNLLSDDDYYNSANANSSTWLPGNDPSPPGWRVPTIEEWRKLFDTEKVTVQRIKTNQHPDKASGRIYIDKTTGNTLFLPAAGHEGGGSLVLYWCNTANCAYFSNTSYLYGIDISDGYFSFSQRYYGIPIRPVAK